jgi:acyl carrier protein
VTAPGLNQQIKELIVEALQLEGMDPASISDSDPLFGSGLSLDSIDALELATAIARKFEIDVGQDDETRAAFRSVNHLAEYVAAKTAAKAS